MRTYIPARTRHVNATPARRPRRRTWRAESEAFSFIELVIVLTILIALAAILLPVLYRGSRQAKSVLCTSNLTKLGTWSSMYLHEADYFLPAYESGWVQRFASQGNVDVDQSAAPRDTFACPSQPFVSVDGRTPSSSLWRGTNYGINQHIASSLKDEEGALTPLWAQLNTREIKDPSSKVLMADTSGSNYFGTPGRDPTVAGVSRFGRTYADALPPTPAQPFPYHRHLDGTANFLMLDGHTQSRRQWPIFMLGPGTYGYRFWHAEHAYPGSGMEKQQPSD